MYLSFGAQDVNKRSGFGARSLDHRSTPQKLRSQRKLTLRLVFCSSAVVTGGGSGIGLMMTNALAANGARVYITGRRKEYLATVVEKYGQGIEGEIIA